MAIQEKLIKKPEGVSNKDFYCTEITFPDVLPKDKLLELQQIQMEMQQGLEYRKKAMERLGKEDINDYINNIDADVKANPEFYGRQPKEELNSGFNNGETPVEQVRKEMTGQNGGNQ